MSNKYKSVERTTNMLIQSIDNLIYQNLRTRYPEELPQEYDLSALEVFGTKHQIEFYSGNFVDCLAKIIAVDKISLFKITSPYVDLRITLVSLDGNPVVDENGEPLKSDEDKKE